MELLDGRVLPAVTATFSGGTGAYQVRIDGGSYATQTSPFTFTALAAGSHTVDLKDANDCTSSASITVNEPAAVAVTPASLPGATTGVAYSETVGASGGTSPFTFVEVPLSP
jgi:hypothetical protein